MPATKRSQTPPAQKPKHRPFAVEGTRSRYAPARTFDIRHIQLELTVDERQRHISGTASLTLSAINDGLREFSLDLDSCMRVQHVRTGKRHLTWEHLGEQLRIQLPRAAAAGQQVQVAIDYEGTPTRGLWFTAPDKAHPSRPVTVWSQGQDEDSRYWFPCWDSPNDKFTSEMRVTVRQPYTVISNGKLLAVTENKRKRSRTFHWREDFPHPAYLTSLVIGEFHCVTETVDGVELQYYVHPSDRKTLRYTFGRTPEMLRFFSKVIDYPYPYEKYSQVLVPDFIFGGMENISATTLTDNIRLDAISAQETFTDWLVAHELAHQWWGNLLTCKEWSHAWLNEGFATYFEALFTEHHVSREEFLWQMQTQASDYFAEDLAHYRRRIVERRWTKPIEIFDSHLYEKGGLVLHMLRFELGEELFWKALRHYARKHQFQNVETADLKVAIEESTGHSMELFFDQWIHASGFPQLQSDWDWRETDKHVALRIQQTQEIGDDTPLFDFPLEIEIGYGKTTQRLRLRVRNVEETFHLPCKRRPLYVRVDPDHWILKKLEHKQGRSELLAQLSHADDFLGLQDAAAGLERFRGDEEVVRCLSQALRKTKFFGTRRAVALAMGRVGGKNARNLLIRALRDRSSRCRRGFVRALGEFRDDVDVVSALQKTLAQDKSYIVRAQIIETLVRLRAPKAVATCKKALREDSHRDMVRVSCLNGLAQLEEATGIDLALQHAAPGGSRWRRAAAMQALAALGRVHRDRARAIQDVLESYLDEDLFFTQLAAAQALGKLARPQASAALQRLMQRDGDGRLQKAARTALEQLSSRSESPAAWQALREEVDGLRRDNNDMRGRVERLEGRLLATPRTPAKKVRSKRRV